jgi:uncharacterized protein
MNDARYWIDVLELKKHPEGGYFRETYRSGERAARSSLPPRFGGDRSFSTAIYYLLTGNDISAFHRIKSDEIWHFYAGSPSLIHCISEGGDYTRVVLGPDHDRGELFQAVIGAGTWFAVEVSDTSSFSLTGCTVSPGFDFNDFELAEKETLIKKYERHTDIIRRLCR